jgi:hypothetical protein
MRSFTFDVIVTETASGRITRTTQGGPWLRLAKKMVRDGTAQLIVESGGFMGYGQTRDTGYSKLIYTVTEVAE